MKNLSWIIVLALIGLNLLTWREIVFSSQAGPAKFYFLQIGQGDSTLVELPTGAQILTDAGPTKKVVDELQKVMAGSDRYIDLVVVSHPQLDHFNGFNDVLDRYQIGAFIFNGRESELPEWKGLMAKVKEKKIPLVTLAEGDRIKNGGNVIDFISPTKDFIQSAELNDTGLVELIKTEKMRMLLTADIGANVEKYLVEKFGGQLAADILKVPHHGSKYSSSEEFLKAIQPKVAVIEVGQNKYGHPTKEALDRLEGVGAKIFRTDRNGTVTITTFGDKMEVFEN
ncbi:MAG: MBL fold metallo-hydrolase [Candidatus Liptonbacteria bacterium]|nr:MBL fold metallo-hydrolase [Candidatus Liptonbacteria bacterium]